MNDIHNDVSMTYLYEYIVILNNQRADVDVSRERVVPVSFCAHLSSARDVLHICHTGRHTDGMTGFWPLIWMEWNLSSILRSSGNTLDMKTNEGL